MSQDRRQFPRTLLESEIAREDILRKQCEQVCGDKQSALVPSERILMRHDKERRKIGICRMRILMSLPSSGSSV